MQTRIDDGSPVGGSVSLTHSEIPVVDTTDVLVAGGGIAGIAAALSASRGGAKVLLIEKSVAFGGLATLGNVIVYLPLCDGTGRQVSAGIAEELLLLAETTNTEHTPGVRPGFASIPVCWRESSSREARTTKRYTVEYNASTYLLALEELLLREGVRILYDTRCISVIKEAGRISHIVVADKSGISAIGVGNVIDGTGDADICAWSDESIESCTTNVACGWFYYLSDGEVKLSRSSDRFAENPSELPVGVTGYSCGTGSDVSAQVIASRKLMRKRLATLGPEAHPIGIPGMASFRMSRRLRGSSEISAKDASGHDSDDTIGIVGDWRRPGPSYAIPFGSLYGRTPNLLAVGRCISVANDLWDVTRAIPACAVTGQAAGSAAALAVSSRCDPSEVAVTDLRESLQKDGVIITRTS